MRGDVPWRDEVCPGSLPIADGQVMIPETPGWSVEVDEVAARRYPYRPEPPLDLVQPDGSISDW
jgi:L-alanine-DL-glutamate epimerase-like enolase superfamily enzyme